MIKTLKRITFAAAVACMTMLFAGTASAETKEVTTTDGLVTITLPNEKWFQVPSETNTEVFSDGDCAILFDVYRSDDQLPGIVKVDEQHLIVYNSAAATKDYVFVATGMVSTAEDYDGIRTAIDSMTVNQNFITNEMLNHKVKEEEYIIEEASYTAWVSADELNVRDASSTEGAILATLYRGEEVQVTGIIKKNGEEVGWDRVSVNGMSGYVSAQFLTPVKAAEAAQSETSAQTDSSSQSGSNVPVKTGNTFKLYDQDGWYIIAYEYTDGEFRDESGGLFRYGRPGVWIAPNGMDVFTNDPTGGVGKKEYSEGDTAIGSNDFAVVNEYGATLYIHDGGDGYFYTSDGRQFWRNEAYIYIDTNDHSQWWQ